MQPAAVTPAGYILKSSRVAGASRWLAGKAFERCAWHPARSSPGGPALLAKLVIGADPVTASPARSANRIPIAYP